MNKVIELSTFEIYQLLLSGENSVGYNVMTFDERVDKCLEICLIELNTFIDTLDETTQKKIGSNGSFRHSICLYYEARNQRSMVCSLDITERV